MLGCLLTVRVLEVMADDSIALCLTPQAFHNVNVSVGQAGMRLAGGAG